MKAVVSEKGQVTIPKAIRDRLGIRPGQAIEFDVADGALVGRCVRKRDPLDELYGRFPSAETTDEFIDALRGPVDIP
ncbi:MAG: AbrB/MazE/SpoVT family DNA-binding domain-containing protein [Chloroflexi bacterium]|nr:AbrB/MazE/SpoVT family DNA-binding domain-containing protein [Chloroflexota bacterium]